MKTEELQTLKTEKLEQVSGGWGRYGWRRPHWGYYGGPNPWAMVAAAEMGYGPWGYRAYGPWGGYYG